MKVLRINIDGSMNDINISHKKVINQLNAVKKSGGDGEPTELYHWDVSGKRILLYGWYDGDAGFENKHELIPNGISKFLEEDSSEKILFGDIFLISRSLTKDEYIDFSTSDYAEVYNLLFDGFDECEEDDEDEEEGGEGEGEEEEDEDFIVNDESDESSDDTYEIDTDELDEDLSEY